METSQGWASNLMCELCDFVKKHAKGDYTKDEYNQFIRGIVKELAEDKARQWLSERGRGFN